jgi:long-chain acyl-CoA synthetase
MVMAQACAFNAVPICTAYDSLGPDGLAHSLNETEVRAMFTNVDLLGTLAKVLPKAPSVRLVVYDGKHTDEATIQKVQSIREGLTLIHIDEVRAKGKAAPKEAVPCKREDVYCCMYTSGSTGTPKGVLLTHGNVTSASE